MNKRFSIKEWQEKYLNEDVNGSNIASESKILKEKNINGYNINVSKANKNQLAVIRYEFDISEFSDDDEAQEFADEIMQLKSSRDVYDYYIDDRDQSNSVAGMAVRAFKKG
jgi:hypothetical protein